MEKLKGRQPLEDIGIGGKIILSLCQRNRMGKCVTKFIWLRMRPCGRLL
jgi:hypothetical protein